MFHCPKCKERKPECRKLGRLCDECKEKEMPQVVSDLAKMMGMKV